MWTHSAPFSDVKERPQVPYLRVGLRCSCFCRACCPPYNLASKYKWQSIGEKRQYKSWWQSKIWPWLECSVSVKLKWTFRSELIEDTDKYERFWRAVDCFLSTKTVVAVRGWWFWTSPWELKSESSAHSYLKLQEETLFKEQSAPQSVVLGACLVTV